MHNGKFKKIAKNLKILKKKLLWRYFKLLGWNSLRKSKNKNYRSVPFRSNPMHNGIFQKNSKKIKNIKKKTIMALFQAKIGWKMLRKSENKNYSSVSFLPDT